MERDSRSAAQGKGRLEELMRERIRGTIEIIVEQELAEALGAASSARVGEHRAGYRHGHRARRLSTSLGASTIAMPRARIEGALPEKGRELRVELPEDEARRRRGSAAAQKMRIAAEDHRHADPNACSNSPFFTTSTAAHSYYASVGSCEMDYRGKP